LSTGASLPFPPPGPGPQRASPSRILPLFPLPSFSRQLQLGRFWHFSAVVPLPKNGSPWATSDVSSRFVSFNETSPGKNPTTEPRTRDLIGFFWQTFLVPISFSCACAPSSRQPFPDHGSPPPSGPEIPDSQDACNSPYSIVSVIL